MSEKTFDFRKSDIIRQYGKEAGFGFITEEGRRNDELLRLSELALGFEVPYWYRDENMSDIKLDEHGCYIDSEEVTKRVEAQAGRLIPLCFMADVEQAGNYEVSVEFYGEGEVFLFAGARRLVYRGNIVPARSVTVVFPFCVCDVVPRTKTVRYDRRSVGVSLLGKNAKLSSLTIRRLDCPTIHIAGDSTVTDQPAEYPYSPATSYSGWGQMLGLFISGGVSIANHSHSGLTVESFRTEGHYDILKEQLKAGDYVFMQFAHNDQKQKHLMARGGYRDGLIAYIKETREAGAFPVIVTPLARNTWKPDGTYNDLLEEYANVCVELGSEYNVPVLDLHALSMAFVKEKGLEGAKPYYFPRDYTHTNDYGAYKMAGFIADEIRGKIEGLSKLVTYESGAWEPHGVEEPPAPPERYRYISNPAGNTELFADLERPDDMLIRAEAIDMVIKAAKFFPINVFNDVYDDIAGHEWYAGAVECAYQNEIIPPQMVENKRLMPQKQITVQEFIALMMSACKGRRALPKEEPCVYDDKCAPYCVPFVRAAYSMGIIGSGEDMVALITRGHAAKMCRGLNI